MIKKIFFFLTVIAFFGSCNTVTQADKRMETISDFITAVKSNDTNKLYEIIDTSAYFDVQDKEHLFYQVNFLQNKLVECGSNIGEFSIKISHRDIPFTDYTYSFCGGNENKFDVRFTFSEFENKNKISFIDIKNNFQNTTPTQ